MATRRLSNADNATGGTLQGASPDELIMRIGMLEQVLVVGDLWAEFSKTVKLLETNATFRSASTDLDHALVVCDLTQISKRQIRFFKLAPK